MTFIVQMERAPSPLRNLIGLRVYSEVLHSLAAFFDICGGKKWKQKYAVTSNVPHMLMCLGVIDAKTHKEGDKLVYLFESACSETHSSLEARVQWVGGWLAGLLQCTVGCFVVLLYTVKLNQIKNKLNKQTSVCFSLRSHIIITFPDSSSQTPVEQICTINYPKKNSLQNPACLALGSSPVQGEPKLMNIRFIPKIPLFILSCQSLCSQLYHPPLHLWPYEVRGGNGCEIQGSRMPKRPSSRVSVALRLGLVVLLWLPPCSRVTTRASDTGGKKTPVWEERSASCAPQETQRQRSHHESLKSWEKEQQVVAGCCHSRILAWDAK